MSYVDFSELKAKVSITDVFVMLDIDLKRFKIHGDQLRGACPIHGGDNPRGFVVTPAKGLWYCFSGCGGGDIIALVAKMRQLSTKEAALGIRTFSTRSGIPSCRQTAALPPACRPCPNRRRSAPASAEPPAG
jgi:DNA primase